MNTPTDNAWLDELYNPSINDIMLNERNEEERPVVYLDSVKRNLKAHIDTVCREAVDRKMAEFHLKKGVKYDVKSSDKVIVITPTQLNPNKDTDNE